MDTFPATIRYASGYTRAIVGLALGCAFVAAAAFAIVLTRGAAIGTVGAVLAVALGVAIVAFACARVGDTDVGAEAVTVGTWANLRKTPLRYGDMAQVVLQDWGTGETDYRIAIVMKDGRTFRLRESRLNAPGQRSGPTTMDLLLDHLVARIRASAGLEEGR